MKGEQISQRTYMRDTDTDNSVVMARGKGVGAGCRWANGGGAQGMDPFVTVSTIKIM